MRTVILLYSLLCLTAIHGQSMNQSEKLKMIEQLKTYLQKDLQLSIGNDFYTSWDNKTTTNYLLYISSPDFIKSINTRPFIYFGENEKLAKAEKKKYDSLGYATMLYSSNNTISTKLSESLLNYPEESILFIVIHEAVHQHFRGKSIPYMIEEASCDLVANYASLLFIEKYHKELFKKVKHQKKLNEKFYKNINDAQKLAEIALSSHKDKIYHSADKKMKNLIKRGNEMHKDRYNYGINNAFFVRYENYSKKYFALKQQFIALKNFAAFFKYVEQLAEKKPKIIDTIR